MIMMAPRRILCFLSLLTVVPALQSPFQMNKSSNNTPSSTLQNQILGAAVAFGLALGGVEPALASSRDAAQVNLNSLPPSTVSVQIQDLPVVGSLLSGTYTKVDGFADKSTKPSIVISSPTDKVGAVKKIVTAGHLEFDVNGLVQTHLDVDVGADEAGVAKIRVASNLIPPLPFKNKATANVDVTGKATPWNMVTNMGTGDVYYYNEVTGVSQNEKPKL